MFIIINNIKNKIFKINNKKINKSVFKIILTVWTFFIAITYLKTYNYLFFTGIMVLISLIFLCLFIFNYKIIKKKNYSFLKNSTTLFTKKYKHKIKTIYIIIIFPILIILIANSLLYFLYKTQYFNFSLEKSLLSIELNLFTNLLSPLLFYIFLILLVTSIGFKINKIFKLSFKQKLDNFLFAIGLGFLPITFGIFLLLSIKLLFPITVLGLIFFLTLFSIKEIKNILLKILKHKTNIEIKTSTDILKIASLIIIGIIFSLNFVLVNKPLPNSTDDLHTYFNTPLLYNEYHGIKPLLHFGTANMAQNTEMIYTAIICLLGSSYVVHFSLLMLGLTLLGFFSLIKKLKNSNSAILSSIVLLLIPWNFYYIHTSKVEFFLTFYTSLILLSFYFWVENKNSSKTLFLLSILAGFSIGIKYNAILLLVPLSILIIFHLIKKNDIKKQFKNLIIAFFLVLALFSPWAVKNYIFFKNIIYPFKENIYNKSSYSNINFNGNYKKTRSREVGFLRHSLEQNKYNLFYFLRSIWNQSIGSNIDKGAWINFSVFPFLLLPFFFIRRRKKYFPYVIIATIYFLFWYLLNGSRSWYALPGIMLIYSLLPLLTNNYKIATSIILVTLISASIMNIIIIPPNILFSAGLINKEEYTKDTIPYYKTAKFINNLNLTKKNKILLLGDFRVTLIEHNDEIINVDPYLAKIGFALNNETKQILKNNSISYIIYSNMLDGYENWLISKNISKEKYLNTYQKKIPSIYEDIENLKFFLDNHTEKIFTDNVYTLYKI